MRRRGTWDKVESARYRYTWWHGVCVPWRGCELRSSRVDVDGGSRKLNLCVSSYVDLVRLVFMSVDV